MEKTSGFRWLGALLLGLALALPAAATDVHEYRLDNGMKVLVLPDHRASVAVSQVWYRVGSSSEASGITGISHVLEHMMFKGTERHPAGEFSRIIAANGGEENAFTGRDYTSYYQFLGSDRLAIAFELEADRMRHLTLPEKEFKKELEVVKEERLMRTDDQPEALTFERFSATAWFNSPYRFPVIGWMEDLNQLTVADLRQWYDRWYQPGNATLVVVGDVAPDAVFALAKRYFGAISPGKVAPLKPRQHGPRRIRIRAPAKRYFGAIPPGTVAPVKPRREPRQHGPRRIRIRAPAKVPYLIMGYHVPVLKTAGENAWEPYALDVLANVLDGGDSARLSRELVRRQEVAASAGAGYDLSTKYDTLFLLEANPAQGHTLAEVEAALLAQVERLRKALVSPEELARVKAQVIADDVFQRDSIRRQAITIGVLDSVGLDWRLMDEYVPRIKAVTAEQVRAVARKYLVDDNRTVAELVPLPVDDKQAKETP